MLRRLDADRLENILIAFFRPGNTVRKNGWLEKYFPGVFTRREE
jgi:hypothetical protein